MRLRTLATLAVAALAALAIAPTAPATATATSAPGPLRIAELLANPDPAKTQREFIEVWNPTGTAVDLAGWTLQDAATSSGSFNSFTFASGHLAPGGRIVVWSNGTADARGPSWSTSPSKAVWNDAGDAALLADPQGSVADWFAYGNAAAAPPPGFEGPARPGAAARGLSLALDAAAWSAGAPTPALAPGTVGGMAGATVVNVAPDARLLGVPATAKPGEAFEVEAAVTDGNGAADLATWTLSAGGADVAHGTGAPTAPIVLVAPAYSGPWVLQLTATDAAGQSDTATATVQVRDARLAVTIPGGLLRFPDLKPGDANVAATEWATVQNEGQDAVLPLLDVSPFTGAAGEIPVDGNLWVGVKVAGSNETWLPYAGPLTPLPNLAPGSSLRLSLRIEAVPTPLAAGAYGTTFAVVAA